jgi:hypothetical protein
MKVRLKGNSLRLRLGRSEVSRLLLCGLVEESTAFGALPRQRLVYALTTTGAGSDLSASFDSGRMHVRIPTEAARRWAVSDELAISGSQPVGRGRRLRILIEKDLECLDPAPGESQEDAFPHPQSGALCGGWEGGGARTGGTGPVATDRRRPGHEQHHA